MMKESILIDQDVKSIFIVDDAEWHNLLLKKMLNDCGYDVHTFTNGYELLENLKEHRPHLVISDINMPALDGFELCKRIKGVPECKDIPLVFVSSMDKKEVNGKVEKNGAVGFIQKPLAKDDFLDVVAQKL